MWSNINWPLLGLCLINGLNSPGCEDYDWPGAPAHSVNSSLSTDGPDRTGDTTNPTCDNGVVTMDPGYYTTTSQYSITGCVNMNPGMYMFAGGFDVESDSSLFMAGVIYLPDGEARIQGADAGTVGGDGTPGSGCLGETTLLGGSIVASEVLVKSDGTLSINAFSGGVGAAGGTYVRLYE